MKKKNQIIYLIILQFYYILITTGVCRIIHLSVHKEITQGAQYLEVLVEADYSSWCEGQWQEVGEGEPEPELGEDQQADHWWHVSVTRPGLQRDGHITSTWTTEGKRREITLQTYMIVVFYQMTD